MKYPSSKLVVVVTWVFILIMIIGNITTICLLIKYMDKLSHSVESSAVSTIENRIESLNIDERINKSVVKIIDSLDITGKINNSINNLNINQLISDEVKSLNLKNGTDGKDGIGLNGTNGLNGLDGKNGLTPILTCNVNKNRWEVTYNGGISYEVIIGTDNNKVKCL